MILVHRWSNPSGKKEKKKDMLDHTEGVGTRDLDMLAVSHLPQNRTGIHPYTHAVSRCRSCKIGSASPSPCLFPDPRPSANV